MRIDYDFHPTIVKKIYYIVYKSKKKVRSDPHIHGLKLHEIIFVDHGEVVLELEGKILKLSSGECVFIHGGTRHASWGEDNMTFNFLNIMFHGEIPEKIFGKSIRVSAQIYEVMEKLKQESVKEFERSHELIAAYLTEMILLLSRQLANPVLEKPSGTNRLQHYQSEIVNRAVSIIANEYSNPLNLKKLSVAVGISESHLRTLLKRHTGESFTTILHNYRISVAKHLLFKSTMSFDEIAISVGYRSLSFFFKVFKRITGMTPKSYAMTLGEPEIKT